MQRNVKIINTFGHNNYPLELMDSYYGKSDFIYYLLYHARTKDFDHVILLN